MTDADFLADLRDRALAAELSAFTQEEVQRLLTLAGHRRAAARAMESVYHLGPLWVLPMVDKATQAGKRRARPVPKTGM